MDAKNAGQRNQSIRPLLFTLIERPVCKLQKSLYGLEQAPRAWYGTITSFFRSPNPMKCSCDNDLFIAPMDNIVIILLHVDDLLITSLC